MDNRLDIASAARALRAGEVTSVELVERAIAVADAHDPTLGTFVSRFVGEARRAAEAADEDLRHGTAGPLTGIPLGVKDIVSTVRWPTSRQSLLQDHTPGTRAAAV